MARAERRNEKEKYGKDFASFCQILNRYFPEFFRLACQPEGSQKILDI